MKKLYATLLLLIPFMIKAQTITQADLPTAGTAFTMANDTDYVFPVPAGGTGQVWNYTNIDNNYVDTTGFMSATGTPFTGMYPTSNLASYSITDNSYTYYTSDATGFYINGFVNPLLTVTYNPAQLFLPVPLSFGDSRSNMSRFAVDTTVDLGAGPQDITFVHRTESTFDADGSGTLTTPIGTYQNVLRVKNTQTVYDSIYVIVLGSPVPFSGSDTSTTDYVFVTSGNQVNYIMTLSADSMGTTTGGASYLVASAQVSVPEITSNQQTSVYPNPAFSTLNFKDLTENSSVTIYNANGKEVKRSELKNSSFLNIEGLPSGTYYFDVKIGDKIQKGSFIKQ